MDIKTLKAEHPNLYNEIFEAGEASGVQKEKDRVSAHLILGKSHGALDFAIECIENGKCSNELPVQATYQAAGLKKTEIGKREADNVESIETESDSLDENEEVSKRVANVMRLSKKA